MKARLVLEDATVFEGTSLGADTDRVGLVVFYTGTVGYEVVLTDPASRGQIIVLTYPLPGNYGINEEDLESDNCQVSGLVVNEISRIYSNWKAISSLEDFLKRNRTTAISKVDTRSLTLHLRKHGEMKGIISTGTESSLSLAQKARSFDYDHKTDIKWTGEDNKSLPLIESTHGPRIVLVDLGARRSFWKQLRKLGYHITIVPPHTSTKEIMDLKPHGIIFAGGPGNETLYKDTVKTMVQILGKVPVIGIGLGHLLLGTALGGSVIPLKIGHHGKNQAVRDIVTSKTEITEQHHSFALEKDSLPRDLEITEVNLVDGSVEGLRSKTLPVLGIQYYPVVQRPGNSGTWREFTKLIGDPPEEQQ